eukprot:NODE_56_length_25944_cov_0.235287.p17 type:complete len:103 gc:universal NODE_56_length_25944_cov_0.235287:20945-20637(-)
MQVYSPSSQVNVNKSGCNADLNRLVLVGNMPITVKEGCNNHVIGGNTLSPFLGSAKASCSHSILRNLGSLDNFNEPLKVFKYLTKSLCLRITSLYSCFNNLK